MAQAAASQLTRLGWDLCTPPRTPEKAFQMPSGCICLKGLQAGTLANAHYAPVPAHAWPQIHGSDFSFTRTSGPRAPFPQISQDLIQI